VQDCGAAEEISSAILHISAEVNALCRSDDVRAVNPSHPIVAVVLNGSMDDDQNHPVLSGAADATERDRLDGLIAQIRHDAAGMSAAQREKLLLTRLAETDVPMTYDERARLLDDLEAGGDDAMPT